jgi:ABC-type nitrate/sulfonate/bicarbonate transport system substrate-binding protein
VYVAQQLGYYDEARINLTILPYASTAPETLVAQGAANFGFSYQAGVAYARASGADVVSVFAPDQKGTYAIGVRGDAEDIGSPKDLDGRIYAGFGTPDEGPLLKFVIQADGGKGEFETVTLDSAAYEAVYAGRADFTIPVVTWEGVAAELAGKPLKTFAFTDYGFPDQYSALIISSTAFLEENPDVSRRFLEATAKGYAYAADNPKEAAQLVIDANPGVFTDEQLVFRSQELLASGGYLKDAQGNVGTQSPEIWEQYGSFLFDNGLLADNEGNALATEPDWTTYYTNDFLPSAS